MDLWFNKGSTKSRMPNHKPPAISTSKAEAIIGHLLVNGYLKEEFNYTPYSTLTYLKRGMDPSIVEIFSISTVLWYSKINDA